MFLLQLKSGNAEIFGTGLAVGEWCTLVYPQRTVAASFDGCVLWTKTLYFNEEVRVIIGDQFPVLLGCAHNVLESTRVEAWNSNGIIPGPKVTYNLLQLRDFDVFTFS